MILDAAR